MQREMNILYNDAITFEPLDPFVKISKFKYYDKTQVTDDDKHESFEQFIQDVHDVKSGKYDSDSLEYPRSHFTALPFLYRDIKKNDVKYPTFYTPDPTSPMKLTGVCRKLVLSHFFPYTLLDRVHYSVQKGGNLYELIENISTNIYWSTENVNSACVLACKGTMYPAHTYVMGVEFNEPNPHPLGPWSGRVYEEEDMWYDMKRLIVKSDCDYEKLLQKLVLDYA